MHAQRICTTVGTALKGVERGVTGALDDGWWPVRSPVVRYLKPQLQSGVSAPFRALHYGHMTSIEGKAVSTEHAMILYCANQTSQVCGQEKSIRSAR